MAQETIKLNVETGLSRVEIANELGDTIGEFYFSPTDTGIVSRYESAVDSINALTFDENNDIVVEIEKFTKTLKEQFDYIFGYNVSDGLFNKCAPLTVLKNGSFYFEHVLEGLTGIIEKTMKKRVDKKIARINQATVKYRKK